MEPAPVDYEQYLSANLSSIEKDDRFKHLLLFPKDELEINESYKKTSTLEQLKPELEAEADSHVSECLKSYNCNYKSVSKK